MASTSYMKASKCSEKTNQHAVTLQHAVTWHKTPMWHDAKAQCEEERGTQNNNQPGGCIPTVAQ